jgi:hypothetical protein
MNSMIELEKQEDGTFVARSDPKVPVVIPNETIIDEDYNTARENIHNILKVGQDALDEIAAIASQSQLPESYDVLAKTINSLLDANRSLMKIHRDKRDLDRNPGKEELTGDTINNNVFVGSSAELSRLLENIKNSK